MLICWNVSAGFLVGGDGGASLFQNISLECAFFGHSPLERSIKKMILSVVFPFLLTAMFMLFWLVLAIQKNDTVAYLFRHWIATAYSVFYILYTTMAESFLKIAICKEGDRNSEDILKGFAISESSYWMEDTNIRCYSTEHFALLLAGGIPLILAVFGMPIWLLFVLINHSDKLGEAEFMGVYGFLYKSYRGEHRYWEVAIMVRKALLFVIVAFSHSLGPNLQLVLAMGVLFVSLGAHLVANPFVQDGPNLNRMEGIALSCSIFVFFAGLVFSDPKTSDAGRVINTTVLISSLIITIAYLLVHLLLEAFKGIDDLLFKWGVVANGTSPLPKKILLLAGVIMHHLKTSWWQRSSITTRKCCAHKYRVFMESQEMAALGNSG